MYIHFSEHELIKQYTNCHPNFTPTVIDVGAHFGGVSHYYAELGCKVIAFEPEPGNHQKLVDTMGQYANVTIIQKAISDVDAGAVDFYVSPVHDGIHTLRPFHDTHTQKITVETVRLDETLRAQGINAVGYLKIDIEGADFLALRSFDFEAIKPQIVMVEFMDSRSMPNFNYSYHDMVAYLAPHGYKTWVCEWKKIAVYGRAGQKDTNTFIQCAPYPLAKEPAWGNLIFVLEEDASRFQDVLDSYLATQTRQAQIKALRQRIEQLPMGKSLLQILRKVRRIAS